MLRTRLIPLLAVLGLIVSLKLVFSGLRKPPVAPLLFEPARSPYSHYLSAEGIIEAENGNTNIGVAFPGLITDVYHSTGDEVKKGDPLFKIDTRRIDKELIKAQADENFARTDLESKEKQYSFYCRLKDKAAVSEQVFTSIRYEYELAKDRLANTIALVNIFKTEIERATARAPSDGKVLQAGDAKVGEYANINPFDNIPVMIFGQTDRYHLRIDIDEADAWRYIKGAEATAFVRSNPEIRIPLVFSFIEPFMIPKKSLTGSHNERVDTRVLQVVYTFSKESHPVYVGQILDVFIQAAP
jgi:HlyD family secretion protein